jgi:C1A family cysteine protease
MKKFLFFFSVILILFNNLGFTQTLAPLNPDFINYVQAKSNNEINNQTDDGYFLGEVPSPVILDFSNLETTSSSPKFAASYDLRSVSGGAWLSPVRDQGLEGACWAFATYGAVESYWLKNGLAQADLSEQNLATCHGFDFTPSEGGNYYLSTAYLSRRSGPISEMDDPYTLPANPNCVNGFTPVAYVDQARFLPGIDDTGYSADIIKQAILDYGAIYINMFYDSDYRNTSNNTYYYNGSEGTNHGVLLVGWDNNKVVTGGIAATPSSPGAWIIRNSWGPSWGEAGYFYISYEDTEALSTVAYFPSTTTYNSESSVYGYGELGMCSAYGWEDGSDFGLIKFTASADQLLQSVGSYIVSANSNVEISVYEDFNGTALSGLLGTTSGLSCPFPGYYTFELNSPIPITNGDDYFVRVRYFNADDYNIPVEYAIPDYTSGAVIESGKCWISSTGSNGSWTALGSDTDYEDDICINVYATDIAVGPPTAEFTASPLVVMVGEQVSFTDLSTGVPDSWEWSFEQGTPLTSDEQNPIVSWSQPGTYDISLTVSNSFDSDQITEYDYITVLSIAEVCDTMSNIYDDDVITYYLTTGGFISGHNGIGFSEFAEYYENPNHNNLTGMIVGVAKAQANSSNPVVRCKVWADNNGIPGAELYTEDFATGSFIEGAYNEIVFSSEVTIPDNFYVGYEIFYETPVDTFCVYMAQGRGASSLISPTAYTIYSGNWYNLDDIFQGGLNTAYLVYPVLCPREPEADFIADITEGCEQIEVQFTDQSIHNPTSWYWEFGDGETSTQQNPLHTYNLPGTYTVSLTASNSQGSNEFSITDYIQVYSVPSVDLGDDFEHCGGNAEIDAGEGFESYVWNGTAGIQTHTVNISGTYTVVVSDANTCTATDEVEVTIHELPTVDLGDDQEQCGGSVIIDAGEGFESYEWNGTVGEQEYTANESGTYTVLVTDVNTCTATDQVEVTIHDIPTVDLGDDQEQCGGNAIIDAGEGFESYEWNGTIGEQQYTAIESGTYTVVVTDANGCTATDQMELSLLEVPLIDAGDDIDVCGLCAQFDAISAGMANGHWEQTTGATIEQIPNPNSNVCADDYATYAFVWTESNGGCVSRDTVHISFWEKPDAQILTDEESAVCGLCFYELNTSEPGEGQQGYWLDISSPYSLFTYQNAADFDTICVENNGVHNLIWIVETGPYDEEPGFCNDTAYMQIDFMAVPVLDFETTDESVVGASDGEITLTISEGLPPYTINWSTGNDTQTISNLSEGIYSVTVTDDNACITEGSDTVYVYNTISGEKMGFVNVYPNPTQDILFINSDVEIEYIELYDALGRKIMEKVFYGKQTEIDFSALAAGNYSLNIKCRDAAQITKQIVKQ